MTDKRIEVDAATAYIPVPVQLLQDWGPNEFMAATRRAFTDTGPKPQPVHGPPTPPDLWLRIIGADLGSTSRAVLDLHHPEPELRSDGTVYGWCCAGCDSRGYDAEAPEWPCRTVDLITERAGIA